MENSALSHSILVLSAEGGGEGGNSSRDIALRE